MPGNPLIINLFYILGCAFGCTLVCVMSWRSGGCWAWGWWGVRCRGGVGRLEWSARGMSGAKHVGRYVFTDEFRSTNGQLQWIISEALRKSGRLKKSKP